MAAARTAFLSGQRPSRLHRKTVAVSGISWRGCEDSVETALGTLAGVTRVDADHEADAAKIVVDKDATDADIRAAIESAGYDVSG